MKRTHVCVCISLFLAATALAGGQQFSDWLTPENVGPPVNSTVEDHQPFVTKDGLSMYFTRIDRPGTNQDIWVSHRASVDEPWGDPERLPATINGPTTQEATPFVTVDGHWLYFAGGSKRTPAGFGANDLWVSWRPNKRVDSGPGGWQSPVNLGPNVNTAAGERAPWLFEDEDSGTITLYFDSSRSGNSNLYYSTLQPDGTFGPAMPISELNTGSIEESPSVSHNGREVYFASDRTGSTVGPDGIPSPDIWVARRMSTTDPWSAPEPVTAINSPFHEGRPSLLFGGSELYFFSARPENPLSIFFDIWVSKREKVQGSE